VDKEHAKYKRILRVGHETVWVGVGIAASVLGGIYGIKLLTSVLPPEQYGLLALGMTVASFFQQVFFLPVGNAGLRFFSAAQDEGTLADLLSAIKMNVYFLALAIVLLALPIYGVTSQFASADIALLMMFSAIYGIGLGTNGVLNNIQDGARNRIIASWHIGFETWVRFLTGYVFVKFIYPDGYIAMLGYLLSSIVVIGSQLFFVTKSSWKYAVDANTDNSKSDSDWKGSIFSYAWPFAAWGVFTWCFMASDRWLLLLYEGEAIVGLYAVLFQLGYYPVLMLHQLVSKVMQPILFGHVGSGDQVQMDRARRFNRTWLVISAMVSVVIIALSYGLSDWVFRLFVDSAYHSVSVYLPIMVVAACLFVLEQTVANVFFVSTKTAKMLTPRIAGSVLGILLIAAGGYYFGLMGVLLARVLGNLIRLCAIGYMAYVERLEGDCFAC